MERLDQFIKFLESKTHDELGTCSNTAFELTKLYNLFKKQVQQPTLYLYGTVITLDESLLDDHLFNKFGERTDSVSRIEAMVESAWETDVEKHDGNLQTVMRFIKDGYKLLEHVGVE